MALWILLVRILRGEKLRKAERFDHAYYSGFLVVSPIIILSFIFVIHRMSTMQAWLLGLLFTGFGAIGYLGCMLWSRNVPIRYSYSIAAVEWVVVGWLAYRFAIC
jgi:hypothetical protein